MNGTSYDLTLELEQAQERWVGAYRVDAVQGSFVGTLDGTTLHAELSPSADCAFTLTGVVQDDALEAEFVPVDCPGGEGGAWSLVRQ